MRLPQLTAPRTRETYTQEFRGYSNEQYVGEGFFRGMENMSCRKYPALTTRAKRSLVAKLSKPHGVFCHGTKLGYVDGTGLYYDGRRVVTVTDTDKQIVIMGAYVLVWPDKVYYNTTTGESGGLENTKTLTYIDVYKCDVDGNDPVEGAETVYARIESIGIGAGFKQWDAVEITGAREALTGTFQISVIGPNFIVVPAQVEEGTDEGPITVTRLTPTMDYVCEFENRVWGCSSEKHEIYACKLGDPFNWRVYQALSNDSYAVTVGSPGNFTGCVSHLGSVLFFKEDVIHKVFGNKPSNYQLNSLAARGVRARSEHSLLVVNEALFYQSVNDICMYDGNLPATVSAPLGPVEYSHAASGKLSGILYLSTRDADGNWHLFTLDTARGLWAREDDLHVTAFAGTGRTLYALCADGKLYAIGETPAGATGEDDVRWCAETGEIGLDTPYNKYISKVLFRCVIGTGAWMEVAAQYDTSGVWEPKGRVAAGESPRTIHFPIIPNRCDHMAIRLRGQGEFTLMSISRTIEDGSEIQEGRLE